MHKQLKINIQQWVKSIYRRRSLYYLHVHMIRLKKQKRILKYLLKKVNSEPQSLKKMREQLVEKST